MDSLASMLRLDLPGFAYDPAYAAQVESFNGGAPENKYFKIASGQWNAIDPARRVSGQAIRRSCAPLKWVYGSRPQMRVKCGRRSRQKSLACPGGNR